ncbi:MAG: [cytidine(C)-cytidine(C)-adenosine (A)]-adding enzyme [Deltaproteobacteria bacterium]|nr:[cytidine(C)-cytidine(C)-adenosine (A)]-adding enzyme [Deltaproteobacteria bacterium]
MTISLAEATVLERLRAAVPENVRVVCETLAKAGFQSVTVGGAVRDAVLGITPGDWDVATAAVPEEVMKLFKRVIATGVQHGTVTIVTGRGIESHVEVTAFRGEGAYTDARRPDHVRFGVPLVEDLARRDLRVNAMAYDPAKHELIDPYAGMADLEAKLLRAVGPTGNPYEDAVGRFTEDGLRVMRAVRFASQLEFALDPETERGITPALPSLAKVSRERVSVELRKILGSRRPSLALRPAWRSGIIESILPELVAGFAAWDEVSGGRDDLVEAWLSSIDAAPPEARLGTLLAELAPPSETSKTFDRASVRRAEAVLKKLKFSNEEAVTASVVVGAAPATVVAGWTEPEARRLLAEITRPHAAAAVGMWRSNQAMELHDLGAAILARGDALATADLAITGNDLMTELGMPAGPQLGKILRALLDRVLDDPALNTREQLLALART